jgi:hypothetical protein
VIRLGSGRRIRLFATAFAALTACGPGSSPPPPPIPETARALPLDHIIIGIDSLERGMQLLADATGIMPVLGGVHPGRGTRNALLSLGERRYIELMAPDPAQAGASPQVAMLRTLHTLTPIGWAIHVSNADSGRTVWLASHLSPGTPSPGSRMRPDGRLLRWRTLDPFGIASPVLPFAIEWDSASVHPSADAPRGCSLTDLRIVSPRAGAIRDALQRARIAVEVDRGESDAIQVALACPRGRINLP